MLLGLSACTTVSSAPSDPYCLIEGPITTSRQDTAATVSQVDAHNRRYVCVCQHDCPPGQSLPPVATGAPMELDPTFKN